MVWKQHFVSSRASKPGRSGAAMCGLRFSRAKGAGLFAYLEGVPATKKSERDWVRLGQTSCERSVLVMIACMVQDLGDREQSSCVKQLGQTVAMRQARVIALFKL